MRNIQYDLAIKLIIFDCDGVLVDSEALGNNIFAELLASYGYRITSDETVVRFRGMKLADCLEILERETSIKLPDTFEVDLRRRMSFTFREHLRPVVGATQLVRSLRIPFCVASSGPRRKVEENLRTTKLYPHFEEKIFSSYDVDSWKPEPGLFLHAAAHFGVAPSECAVVEDSFVGVSAGIAAKMQVLALDVFGDDESLSAASRVFTSLRDIHQYMASENWAKGIEVHP